MVVDALPISAILYSKPFGKSILALCSAPVTGFLMGSPMISSIPSTFTDASGFTLITLTDVTGTSLSTTVSVSSLQNNASGYLFSTGALNTAQDLSVTVNYSFVDGTDTCANNQSSVITGLVPCSTPVTSAITSTEVTVTFSNLFTCGGIKPP